MSTRYIWGKYTYVERYYKDTYEIDQTLTIGSSSGSINRLVCLPTEPTLNNVTGKFSFTGTGRVQTTSYADPDTNDYPYAIFRTSSEFPTYDTSADVDLDDIVEYVGRRYTNTKWNFTIQSNKYILQCYYNTTSNTYPFYHYMSDASPIPDDLLGYVSSNRSSEYPSFDLDSDGYFYYAEDQDVIDPSSVNLPESIRYNSDITISITPSSDAQTNSYGNITYTYQYKFDNGSWTTIETTSETSVELHIPSDKSSIQARVLAQDDIGFTSSTYVLSSAVSIYASDPPSAPSSISVDRTVEGFTTTVTVGEATDTDGTIANYIFERKTQYGDWTQVQSSADLTFVDNPNGSWGTVQYRVCAVDNSGTKGPYITSETYTVLTDVIVIMGPSKKDFGVKIGNFNLSFYVIVAGDTSATGITVTVKIDSQQTFTSTVDTEELVTGTVEVTNLSEGQHTITVTASKGGYTTANETYTFRIEGLTLPEGGNAVQFQDSTGKPVIPISRAEAILFSDGRTLEEVIQSLMS